MLAWALIWTLQYSVLLSLLLSLFDFMILLQRTKSSEFCRSGFLFNSNYFSPPFFSKCIFKRHFDIFPVMLKIHFCLHGVCVSRTTNLTVVSLKHKQKLISSVHECVWLVNLPDGKVLPNEVIHLPHLKCKYGIKKWKPCKCHGHESNGRMCGCNNLIVSTKFSYTCRTFWGTAAAS